MKNVLAFIVGFVGSPVTLALRLYNKEWPRWPTDEEFKPDNEGGFWHYSKNASATVIQRNPHLVGAALLLALLF